MKLSCDFEHEKRQETHRAVLGSLRYLLFNFDPQPWTSGALRLRPPPACRYLAAMGRVPLEDNYNDVIAKAQQGLGIDDAELAHRAQVPPAALASLKAGHFDEYVGVLKGTGQKQIDIGSIV